MKTETKSVILIVDDEPANIFLLEGILSNEGFEVVTSDSGKQALSVLSEQSVDAVLLDHMMPGMSGLDVLDVIVKDPDKKNIPVIMVTAKSESEDVQEALERGAIDFIKKPINEIELLARLRSVVRLKQQEDHVRTLLKSKEDFLRIVSHDLRTPFASISGFAEMLLTDKELEKKLNNEHREYILIIIKTSLFIVDYFNKLLDWSNIGSNELKLIKIPTLASKLINTSYLIYRPKIEEKNISYKTEIEQDVKLNIDPTYFSQVISNLLSNAIKFTPEKGIISIKVCNENNNVLIKIKDSGTGISGVTPDELFNKSFHKSTAGTAGEKGTGIGLNICKRILDAHGFGITFQSIPQQGTEFIIRCVV